MFSSLEEQVESMQGRTTTRTRQALRHVGVFFVALLLFGGMYLAIILTE